MLVENTSMNSRCIFFKNKAKIFSSQTWATGTSIRIVTAID